LKKSALVHGRLKVPAWGANTVRSEFAFLSGVSAASLGVHRFNPYRKMVAWGVPTLASYLKQMGYRTICVHPYPAGFYGRDKIYPMMGFDEFIDIREFTSADRSGAYVGDMAVAKKIASILEGVTEPVFIHAITMENHGPLHLEKSTPADIASLYKQPPPSGCNDLTIYLRHLRNADRMMSMLKDTMTKLNRPASLCWFGDHVPIMESVYDVLGLPDGQTEFLIWQTAHSTKSEVKNLEAHQLGANWLRRVGLML
jgi:phosphoglycerol transferase MdoB-like AlkP superfamily enzyme